MHHLRYRTKQILDSLSLNGLPLSLRLKLIFAFLLVSLIGAFLVAFFARSFALNEFDRFALQQAQRSFINDATNYYELKGSWDNVTSFLERRERRSSPDYKKDKDKERDRDGGRRPPPPPLGGPLPFVLADSTGIVVVPARPYHPGEQLSPEELAQGLPLFLGTEQIGTVINTAMQRQRNPWEREYLGRINQAFMFAVLGATTIALMMGIFLARSLTRPVRALTQATQAMAEGDLQQELPVNTKDELGELTQAFNKMSAELAHAHQLRRQMTADIAHDLRTPLSVIKGYTEALSDGILKPSPQIFQVMHQEVEHLSVLVQDLRTLSLADAGELTLNREETPPQRLLERVMMAHLHQATQQEIGLHVEADASLPTIEIDPERIAQVLGNLVSNALRYTPKNGHIYLSANRNGKSIYLAVRDTGQGIAPEKLPNIFERFYRGDKSRQQKQGDESGLGLAIAKSIVEAHAGTISVDSRIGQGTTFQIALPLQTA